MERNVGAISPADRRFYRQTRGFLHQLKIYRQIHEKIGGRGAGVSLSVGKKVQSEVQKQDSVN